jgi:hypothetical protein
MKILFEKLFGKMEGTQRKLRTQEFRPRLEALEDRLTPATIVVTTFTDTESPADGKVTELPRRNA